MRTPREDGSVCPVCELGRLEHDYDPDEGSSYYCDVCLRTYDDFELGEVDDDPSYGRQLLEEAS